MQHGTKTDTGQLDLRTQIQSATSPRITLPGTARTPAEIETKDILQAKKRNHISLNEYEWVGLSRPHGGAKAHHVHALDARGVPQELHRPPLHCDPDEQIHLLQGLFRLFTAAAACRRPPWTRRCCARSPVDAGKVVYKPNCKGQGTGVRILPAATEAEQADALAYLRANSGGIVEEYIQQHPTLAQLNPGAVSIVRFYTVTAPSGTYLFAPVLTTAIEKDISNGCQDALTAMIDIRTGVVLTDAVDQNNFIDYHTHPVTGVPFPGLQLPFWAETIDMMRRAVPLASKISNIGWDVTMTADGPLIIEANTIPGFNTARVTAAMPGSRDGYGLSAAVRRAQRPPVRQ